MTWVSDGDVSSSEKRSEREKQDPCDIGENSRRCNIRPEVHIDGK